jgi:hypothetical protein
MERNWSSRAFPGFEPSSSHPTAFLSLPSGM